MAAVVAISCPRICGNIANVKNSGKIQKAPPREIISPPFKANTALELCKIVFKSYNILIRNMEMVRIDRGADKILSDHLDEYDTKKLVSARKAHPERGYIVFLSVAYESLQSPKVEGGDKPNMRFLVVEKDEGWKIAWFDK